jgi:Ca2+:H+ antiporter
MNRAQRLLPLSWTTFVPPLALLLLIFALGRTLPAVLVIVVAVVIAAAVLAAVHHAEVVAHRVGEPFGSLVLAIAVTIIEVGLILVLMSAGGHATETLARDTVFAAVMITCNGILGIAVLVGALRYGIPVFNSEGAGSALATVATLAALCLVFPAVTTSGEGAEYSTAQLIFAAVGSLALYVLFVFTQTVRHRDFFLPVTEQGEVVAGDDHAERPSGRAAAVSLGLLLISLVGLVGLTKVEAPAIESAVHAVGLPATFVGVIIALLVLLPETIAAVRAARQNHMQISLNLALGSAMASIGLTIPTIAVVALVTEKDLVLGLAPAQLVLLALTIAVGILTVVPGRATRLQAGVHLVLFSIFILLAITP